MPRWASGLLAMALLLSACGQAPPSLTVSTASSTAGGVAVRLISSQFVDTTQPWEKPPAGFACLHYVVEGASVDGGRHELRAEQFSVTGAAPAAAAVGGCDAPQLEPTWIGPQPVDLSISFLIPAGGSVPPLSWTSGG
jgi:hypothetical protein